MALERMVLLPGSVNAETKRRMRTRLDPLLTFLEAPPRESPVTALRHRLEALARFGRTGPVDGSHELFERYKSAIAAKEARLRERIQRLEPSSD